MEALITCCGLHQWALLKWGQELAMVSRALPCISGKGSNGRAPESKLNVSTAWGHRGLLGPPGVIKLPPPSHSAVLWICREKKKCQCFLWTCGITCLELKGHDFGGCICQVTKNMLSPTKKPVFCSRLHEYVTWEVVIQPLKGLNFPVCKWRIVIVSLSP